MNNEELASEIESIHATFTNLRVAWSAMMKRIDEIESVVKGFATLATQIESNQLQAEHRMTTRIALFTSEHAAASKKGGGGKNNG